MPIPHYTGLDYYSKQVKNEIAFCVKKYFSFNKCFRVHVLKCSHEHLNARTHEHNYLSSQYLNNIAVIIIQMYFGCFFL